METDNLPLPDTMYCRDCAIRLLRHAAWYIMALRLPIAPECVNLLGTAQKEVLQMNTGDFYRIKVMGVAVYRANVTLCAICHVNFVDAEAGFDTCDSCIKRQ